MKTSFPVDRLQEAHQRHYQPGTWELFVQWFERSGYGDVLRLPWLNDGESQERLLSLRISTGGGCVTCVLIIQNLLKTFYNCVAVLRMGL